MNLPIHKFTDTMVRAYHLCLGGGGDDEDSESKAGRGSLSLKVLAYRHLNMKMTSFRDTVYPYSIPQLAKWLDTATDVLSPLPPVKKRKGDPKPPPSDKSIQRLYTKTKRLANRLTTDTNTDWANSKKDPWKFIRTNWQEDLETLETIAGPIPTPSISFVPEPQLLHYAVRDADATLRLFLFMKNLKPWIFYP
jgi:hypothetical protein